MIPGNISRILVIRIDFLGDMVCTTAFLHALKQRWPSAEIHVVANKYNASVLENNDDVAQVYHYIYTKKHEKNINPGKLSAIIDKFKLIVKLRKLKFDLLVIPNGGMHKNAIQFAKNLNIKDSRWHTHATEFDDRKAHHIDRPLKHEVLSGFALMPELGNVNIEQLRYYVKPSNELKNKWDTHFGKRRKPRVGIFVSNKSVDRRWAWKKWEMLVSLIEPKCQIIVFHDPREVFPDGWAQHTNVSRVLTNTVPDLIAAMSNLDLVVSADSAPVHLASALDICVVALFESRPEKYLRWYPLGVEYRIIHEGEQVNDIAVSSVQKAIEEIIKVVPLIDY